MDTPFAKQTNTEKRLLPCAEECSLDDDVCKLDHYLHDCMRTEMPNVANHCRFCHSCEQHCSENTMHRLKHKTDKY